MRSKSGMLSGMSALNSTKPKLYPKAAANPNSTGTKKTEGEKLNV